MDVKAGLQVVTMFKPHADLALSDDHHGLGELERVDGELVGVPAFLHVAAVASIMAPVVDADTARQLGGSVQRTVTVSGSGQVLRSSTVTSSSPPGRMTGAR
ncbi:MAG: hypothetical protein WC661_21530 [Opitutaceae bacterium]|jgi:hypothetical protein